MVHIINNVLNMPYVSKIAIIFDPNSEFIPVNEDDFSLRKTIVDLNELLQYSYASHVAGGSIEHYTISL